jgi:tripeptidyl-peptidase I
MMLVSTLLVTLCCTIHGIAAYNAVARLSFRNDVTKQDRVPSDILHQLVIACKQSNLKELERIVDDISNPRSPNFGQHLTKGEVVAMTSNPVSVEFVQRFIEKHHITVVDRTADSSYLTVEAPVVIWERLLGTEFYYFSIDSPYSDHNVIRAQQYRMPEELRSHVSAIFRVVDFPSPFRGARTPQVVEGVTTGKSQETLVCNSGYVCPAVLNTVYDMRSNTGNTLASQAIYASIDQSMSPSDLSFFQASFSLPQQGIATDVGGHVDDNACTNTAQGIGNCAEANLDVQYMMAVSQGIPTTFYYTDEDWVAWITTVADMTDPPLIFTISYSAYETFQDPGVTDAFNTEAMKVAAMGVTILSASGDDGVAGYAVRQTGPQSCDYYPQFPASCPYVTAVGGTQVSHIAIVEIYIYIYIYIV